MSPNPLRLYIVFVVNFRFILPPFVEVVFFFEVVFIFDRVISVFVGHHLVCLKCLRFISV